MDYRAQLLALTIVAILMLVQIGWVLARLQSIKDLLQMQITQGLAIATKLERIRIGDDRLDD
jgi:hypothetical protein